MLRLIINVIPWLIVTGMYILIRFGGTQETADWAYNYSAMIIMWLVGGVLLTIFFAFSNYLAMKPLIRKQAYIYIMLLRVIVVFVSLILMSLAARFMLFFQGHLSADEIITSWLERLTTLPTLAAFLYLIVAVSIVSFIVHMSFMTGQPLLINLLLGKYHLPKEEQRIFMFLSLKDFKYNAEVLGHKQYSRLIQDCFHDLTESAIACDVEIYQYVGNEAVLTWLPEKGIKNNNCINVYYQFHQTLQHKKNYYMTLYGTVPQFVAGVNAGLVMVAEIGDIKRDITYLSDVLNTTARIQDQCERFDKSLLISSEIKKILTCPLSLSFKSMGSVLLKGKEKPVKLWSVSPDSSANITIG